MMEDSYEISIIDFLAEEFTQNLLKDPNLIRNKIKSEIKRLLESNSKNVTPKEVSNTESATEIVNKKVEKRPRSTRNSKKQEKITTAND
jgi:3-methyladenine DNA glycosylase Tag